MCSAVLERRNEINIMVTPNKNATIVSYFPFFFLIFQKFLFSHSRIGRGNMTTKSYAPFPTFFRILEALRVEWSGAQRCALPHYQSQEVKILKFSFAKVGSNQQLSRFQSHAFVPAPQRPWCLFK